MAGTPIGLDDTSVVPEYASCAGSDLSISLGMQLEHDPAKRPTFTTKRRRWVAGAEGFIAVGAKEPSAGRGPATCRKELGLEPGDPVLVANRRRQILERATRVAAARRSRWPNAVSALATRAARYAVSDRLFRRYMELQTCEP
jgi:hypothetical protein